jgi:uncharacterized protein (TIGR02391 family)
MPEHYGLGQLTPQELIDAVRVVGELERDGYIQRDPTQAPEFKIPTDRGRAAAEQDLDAIELPSINIEELLSRDDLLNKVRDDYISTDFESAVFKAFKLVEEAVRRRSGQPTSLVGVNLMTAALKPGGGVLHHPEAQVEAEKEGLHQLFRGAIGWFKNPSSHRTVGYSDPQHAAHVLAFANLLLDLLDQCKK